MAAFVQAGNIWNTTSGTKQATVAVSAGNLIILITAHTGNTSDTAPTDDNADGLGTYTAVQTNVKATSADKLKFWVRDAFIGTGASTIFTHAPGATTGGGIRMIEVSGMFKTGASAVRQAGGQDNQAAATPAPALSVAALTTNMLISTVFNGTNPSGITNPPSGWTNAAADTGYNTPASGRRDAYRNSGETGTTMTWGTASASGFCSGVIELDASSTGSLIWQPAPSSLYGR